jgi:primosomal protein N'
MFQRQRQWDPTQCSYCGKGNVQFICWECIESTLETMQAEINKNKTEITRLKSQVRVLMLANGIITKKEATT